MSDVDACGTGTCDDCVFGCTVPEGPPATERQVILGAGVGSLLLAFMAAVIGLQLNAIVAGIALLTIVPAVLVLAVGARAVREEIGPDAQQLVDAGVRLLPIAVGGALLSWLGVCVGWVLERL